MVIVVTVEMKIGYFGQMTKIPLTLVHAFDQNTPHPCPCILQLYCPFSSFHHFTYQL
ncbi:hypothetical protein Sjap_019447 [Stephania japonica]|uniref:Uncharacterized protein n=1 Tax=Stephania japonica TaxID=461633 RepID=A0AAP0HUQ9_9MAGN